VLRLFSAAQTRLRRQDRRKRLMAVPAKDAMACPSPTHQSVAAIMERRGPDGTRYLVPLVYDELPLVTTTCVMRSAGIMSVLADHLP